MIMDVIIEKVCGSIAIICATLMLITFTAFFIYGFIDSIKK